MRRQVRFFKKLDKDFVLKILLTFLNTLVSKRFRPASRRQVYDFKNSGYFYRAGEFDLAEIYREWEVGELLWRVGDYRKSVDIRKKCLEILYFREEISDMNYAPPVMSISWTSAFGHVGFLGVFSAAQKLGIISPQRRVLLLNSAAAAKHAKRIFSDTFATSPSKYGHTALENPSQWHISERLEMIKSKAGFICLYELHDKVFSHPNFRTALPELNPEYIEWSRSRLEEIGLPREAWFVSLHIRDAYGDDDVRKVDVNSFLPAIDQIIKSGGFVIQFGLNSRQQVSPRKGLIHLEKVVHDHLNLHLFLLAKARFLLATNSGPSVVAWSLGTSVLQTNTTSIARNMLRAPTNSIFLPKHYYDGRNRELGFREIASGRLGYSETNLKDLYKLGFSVSNNTSDEILQAAQELLSASTNEGTSNILMKRLNEIRRDTLAVGYGNVATSFLVNNPNWLDN